MPPVMRAVRLLPGLLAGLLLAGQPGAISASDDWNWDAVEAMDDAPVTKKPVAGASGAASAASVGQVRRDADTSEPDFDAPPVQAVALFSGLPPFEVIQSQRDAEMHPCANCHQWVVSNPEPRRLKTPHDNFELQHGLHGHGKFWCFTCHRADKDLGLKTLEGQAVEFADAYIVCSQCHARQAQDWAYGAHGKRVSNWQGKRQVLNCTACHYQHNPTFKAREPMSGPAMRVGLPRPAHWVSATERDGHDTGHAGEWRNDIRLRRAAGDPVREPDSAEGQRMSTSDEES